MNYERSDALVGKRLLHTDGKEYMIVAHHVGCDHYYVVPVEQCRTYFTGELVHRAAAAGYVRP